MIKKDLLERFLSKYSIGGLIETAAWSVSETSISTEGASSDKDIFIFVKVKGLGFEPSELTVVNTSQLRSMLGLFGDEVDVALARDGKGRPLALKLRDGTTSLGGAFALGSDLAKPQVPKIQKLPDPIISLRMDSRVISTFIKSKSVLPDEVACAVMSDGTTAKLVVGYEPKRNTTQVSIEVPTTLNSLVEPIYFNADRLRQALSVNKDADEVIWHVTPPKFSHLTFKLDGFEVDYYVMALDR
jgi:hypothetical protein